MDTKIIANIKERNEVIRNLLQTEQIEFIAQAITPWHAIGVSAALQNYESNCKGVIILRPHGRDGMLIGPDNFELPNEDIHVIEVSSDTTWNSRIDQLKEAIQGILPLIPLFRAKPESNNIDIITQAGRIDTFARIFGSSRIDFNPRFILVDKGEEIYRSDSWSRYPYFKETERDSVRKVYESMWSFAWDRFSGSNTFIDRKLFNYDNGVLKVRPKIREDYRSILGSVSTNSEYGVVLMPLADQAHQNQQGLKNVIRDMIGYVYEQDLHPCLKLHPRADKGDYEWVDDDFDVTFLESDKPVELLVPEIAPSLLIGIRSTALLTCSALFDIPTYTMYRRYQADENDQDMEAFLHRISFYVTEL